MIANKVDDASHEAAIWEFMGLGLGEPFPVSALHGKGTGDLLGALITHLPEGSDREPEEPVSDDPELFSVSLVGRPNVGKSTLFNRLIGEERAVVHDRPGTTRDAIDTIVETQTGPIRFVDTAGMRRKAKIDEDTEYYSLVRALKAVDESDVSLLVIDATIGVTHQDQRLAERVDAAGCPIVILLNKWELLNTEQREKIGDDVERNSASSEVRRSFGSRRCPARVSTGSGPSCSRRWATTAPASRPATSTSRSARPNLRNLLRVAPACFTQPRGDRPSDVHPFVNRELPKTYLRYLERSLREDFNLGSTPIKLRVRKRND